MAMKPRDREEWFWIALLVVTSAIMIGLTVWPWLRAAQAG